MLLREKLTHHLSAGNGYEIRGQTVCIIVPIVQPSEFFLLLESHAYILPIIDYINLFEIIDYMIILFVHKINS